MEEIVLKLDRETMQVYGLDEAYYVGVLTDSPSFYRTIKSNTRAGDSKPVVDVDLSTFIELKNAGFTAGDIIEMYRQKMI